MLNALRSSEECKARRLGELSLINISQELLRLMFDYEVTQKLEYLKFL